MKATSRRSHLSLLVPSVKWATPAHCCRWEWGVRWIRLLHPPPTRAAGTSRRPSLTLREWRALHIEADRLESPGPAPQWRTSIAPAQCLQAFEAVGNPALLGEFVEACRAHAALPAVEQHQLLDVFADPIAEHATALAPATVFDHDPYWSPCAGRLTIALHFTNDSASWTVPDPPRRCDLR